MQRQLANPPNCRNEGIIEAVVAILILSGKVVIAKVAEAVVAEAGRDPALSPVACDHQACG